MLFPVFLYGRWGEVEAAAVELGTGWAYSFEQNGEFPSFVESVAHAKDANVLDGHEVLDDLVPLYRLIRLDEVAESVAHIRPPPMP
jgi:hypothetical protein